MNSDYSSPQRDALELDAEIDKPIFENQSQDKIEFKRFIRMQKEGLVSIKDIAAKQ